MSLSEPRNKREARAWVRKHWQGFIRNADLPDLPKEWSDAACDLVADIFCDEGMRLADRLEPRR